MGEALIERRSASQMFLRSLPGVSQSPGSSVTDTLLGIALACLKRGVLCACSLATAFVLSLPK